MKLSFFLPLALVLIGIYFLNNHRSSKPEGPPKKMTLYGNVDIRQVDLGFEVSGRVVDMLFEEGDFVPAGALMAHLDPVSYGDRLRAAKATVVEIQANLENAQQLVKRRKVLLGTGGISDQDYDDALAQERIQQAKLGEAEAQRDIALSDLEETELFAPNNGTILTRIREPGTVVKPGDPIYTLSLIHPIWIRAFVSEAQLGYIYPGMPAQVYTDSRPEEPYVGKIGFISPVAEFTPKTVETTQLRTDLVYRLRIIIDNADQGLRQGMPVTVTLEPPPTPPPLSPSPVQPS